MATSNKPYFKYEEVKEAAYGNWLLIFARLAPQLNEAVDRLGNHVTDPVYGTSNSGGKGNGFRLFKDAALTGGGVSNRGGSFKTGFALLGWVLDLEFEQVLFEVGEVLGCRLYGDTRNMPARQTASDISAARRKELEDLALRSKKLAKDREIQRKKAGQRIDALWDEARVLSRNPSSLKAYLARRKLFLSHASTIGDTLRFHPDLPYYQENEDGKMVKVASFPALLSAVRNDEGVIETIHRTYITKSGNKAPVDQPRKMMTLRSESFSPSAAIRLGGVAEVIGVAEGFETALSCMQVYQVPVWARLTSSLLPSFRPPEGVSKVIVFGDLDRSGDGQAKAKELCQALLSEGYDAEYVIPQLDIRPAAKSLDFNEMLMRGGAKVFPQLKFF